ncbi:MAG: glycerophosphodiester phosphodiesterase [Luteolibacter sp.]
MRLSLALNLLLAVATSAAPLVVAHRGASGEAPENTLPAFELAWKQGADAIEGDFQLTKDQHIVCIHDADTKKVAGIKRMIKDSTLAELQTLDVGSWKGPQFAGTRIPTLAEVGATLPPGGKFFIEIKCGPEIVPVLLREIEACSLHNEQIVVISFDKEVVRAVRAARPDWTVNWLYRFDTRDAAAVSQALEAVLHTLDEIGASGLASNAHPEFQSAHLERLKAAGFTHHVWTVNDVKTARVFLEIGSRSITTDFPAKIAGLIAKP